MKRCEEKIRYRTAIGAKWSLWGIWLDRYLRGKRRRHERRAYAFGSRVIYARDASHLVF